jgi:cobalamin biosynthesis Mg chelatase CobN
VVLVVAASAAILSVPTAHAQSAASVSVDPTSGPPGSKVTITMKNYHPCASDSQNCIIIDFVQAGKTTRIGTADSRGSTEFSGQVTIPPSATAGAATIHAFSSTDDATTPFTVAAAPATTTTTTVAGSTTSSSSTSTSSSSTTLTTVVPPITEPPTTTTTIATKKSSSHSDVPRYIAVILVVLAAAATALVDTYTRRLGRL